MFQIRRGTFETNSSSSHSIVMMKDEADFAGVYSEKEFAEGFWMHDGIHRIYSDDDLSFSRYPYQLLCTFLDKIRYSIAAFCDEAEDGQKRLNEIQDIVKKYIPEFKGFELPYEWEYHFRDKNGNIVPSYDVYRENRDDDQYYFTNNDGEKEECLRDDEPYREVNYGYIDHQSLGLFESFLRKKDISLEDFLIHKRFIVVIDGDEYQDFERYKKHKLFPVDLIESEMGGCCWDYEPPHEDVSVDDVLD